MIGLLKIKCIDYKDIDLLKFFKIIYGWDELPNKPSEVGISKIIENKNVKDYIMVGDNIDLDLEVPYNMGMDTIFLNTKRVDQNKYREIFKIEDLKDILLKPYCVKTGHVVEY